METIESSVYIEIPIDDYCSFEVKFYSAGRIVENCSWGPWESQMALHFDSIEIEETLTANEYQQAQQYLKDNREEIINRLIDNA